MELPVNFDTSTIHLACLLPSPEANSGVIALLKNADATSINPHYTWAKYSDNVHNSIEDDTSELDQQTKNSEDYASCAQPKDEFLKNHMIQELIHSKMHCRAMRRFRQLIMEAGRSQICLTRLSLQKKRKMQ